jgi:type II secretory pathway pseudopilin PulG
LQGGDFILKECEKGYFLFESVVGLCILSLVASILFPTIIEIQLERATIREQQEARALLTEEMLLNSVGHQSRAFPHTVEGNYQTYSVQTVRDNKIWLVCLNWEGKNSRAQSICHSYFKK